MLCSYCRKCIRGNDTKINCNICNQSVHIRCYDGHIQHVSTSTNWYCKHCIGSILPFNHIIDDNEFLHEVQRLSYDHKISFDDLLKLKINPFDLNDNVDDDTELNNTNYNITNTNDCCNYHCSDTFNKTVAKLNKPNLSLIHFNSRSLVKNYEKTTDYIQTLNNDFSIIAISETWLKSNTHPALINIDNYTIVRSDRQDKKAGGVALYIKNNVNFKIREDLKLPFSQEYESLFIEIESEPKNSIIGVIYRPPDSNRHPFIEHLSTTINKINQEKLPSFICGDLNINLLNCSTHSDTNDYLNTFYAASFYPLIDKPTRVTTKSYSLIDHIFTNVLDSKITPGVLFNDITDHFPIFMILNNNINNYPKTKQKKYHTTRKINQSTMDSFSAELEQVNWDKVLNNSSSDNSYHIFIKLFTELYDKHFPKITKQINIKQQSKPWITAGIIKSIKTRNKLYKSYLSNPNDTNKSRYIKYRNKLTNLIKFSCKKHYADLFNTHKHNIKNTWNTINKVLGKSSSPSNPSYFLDGSSKLSDPGSISNKFNSFFAEIGPKLASQIHSTSSFADFLKDPQPNSIFFNPTHESEILNIVNKFKNGKSAGYDDISPSVVKHVICHISKPLTHIFNLSFSSGVFPSALKIAKIIPVFKKGDPHTFSNYRPISLLPCFSKILERLIFNRLDNFLTHFNILHNNQYGFRKHHSTDLALLDIYNKISSSLALHHHTIGIFLDLSKAFDTIDHNILLTKLQHYGIRGRAFDLLSSYLHNRLQFTSYDSHSSDFLPVSCGVPQGSILGPLLFLLYVNDIPVSSKHFSFVLFADDTNIFLSDPNLDTLINTFNTELEKVSNWFKSNKLSLNVSKTNYIFFNSKNKNHTKTKIKIKIDNTEIHPVDDTKFLGVMIDKHLNWSTHIAKIENQISRNIGVLKKLRHTLPHHILFTLYNTLILPYLSYSNIAWAITDNTFDLKHCPWSSPNSNKLDRLFKLQKRAIRLITDSSYQSHTKSSFHDLKTLTIFDINKLQTGLFMYRYNTHSLPNSFSNFMTKHKDIHKYNTRNASNYITTKYNSNIIKYSIKVTGPKVWNAINHDIMNSRTLNIFKTKLKKLLYNNYI